MNKLILLTFLTVLTSLLPISIVEAKPAQGFVIITPSGEVIISEEGDRLEVGDIVITDNGGSEPEIETQDKKRKEKKEKKEKRK